MRRKFPVFWIAQFVVLTALGLVSLFAPRLVVEFCRGERAPRRVAKPEKALDEWVLGIERVPRPDDQVLAFFRRRSESHSVDRKVRTPDDPSIRKFTSIHRPDDWKEAETDNAAWEAVEGWLLSSEPAPPPEHAREITAWLHAIDEMPEPSQELSEWVIGLESPQPPPRELRLLILRSRQTLPISWRLAADQVRLAAACILAGALFTLFGLLSPAIRRPLARSFVLVILFLTVSMLLSSLGPPKWNLTYGALAAGLILGIAMVGTALRAAPNLTTGRVLWLVLGVWWTAIVYQASQTPHETGSTVAQLSMIVSTGLMAVFGLVNAHYWLIGPREDPPQDDGGIAQRRPPQLWTLWLLQFGIVMLVGLATLIFPDRAAELFIQDDFDHLTTDVVNDAVRLLGAWVIALALFSYFSLGVAQDWIWQSIGWIFCTVFAVLALGTVFNALSGEYSIWGYVYGFQGVVFIPLTLMLLLRRDPWSTENVENVRWHWSLADLPVAIPLLWSPLRHGRRALFRNGTAGRGRMCVLPIPDDAEPEAHPVPANAFFAPGRAFTVEARFANCTQEDDASLDIRGCALRLHSPDAGSLCLFFGTGAYAAASCLKDFRWLLPLSSLRRSVLKHKVFREGMAAGMRRAPSSYADLSFYHPIVLEWLTSDATHYLVRFRLVPASASDEFAQGLPDADDLRHLWEQQRCAGETRPVDYLRREFHDRLAGGNPVSFRLEAQFHWPQRGDSLEWYDASLEWDERTHPWRPLAELTLDQPLTAEESEGLRFDPGKLPPSLRIPMPGIETDIEDPRSLAAAQFRITGTLGRLRTWRHPPPASPSSADPPAPVAEPESPVATPV